MNKSYSYDDQNLFGWKCRLVQIEDTMRFLGQQKIDAEEKVKEFEDAINAKGVQDEN